MSRTVLTVFENTDTINEPVISLPMLGRISFRQIGIIIVLVVLAPMTIYSGMSESILNALPEPVITLDVAGLGNQTKVTWDVILALVPVPFGLAIGIPRPKLLPMDALLVAMIMFSIQRTSVNKKTKARKKKTRKSADSKLAGFAQKDTFDQYQKSAKNKTKKEAFAVNISEIGVPKNITITLYHTNGQPMRNMLVRAYVDDELQNTITTDSDGIMGMTFAPQSEGTKHLRIMADKIEQPVVDVQLDVRVSR